MKRLQLVKHRGKSIVLADASNGPPDECIELAIALRKMVAQYKPQTALLLVDVSGTKYNDEIVRETITTCKANTPHVKASALIGICGLKRIVLISMIRATGRSFKLFDSREAALDWLADQ